MLPAISHATHDVLVRTACDKLVAADHSLSAWASGGQLAQRGQQCGNTAAEVGGCGVHKHQPQGLLLGVSPALCGQLCMHEHATKVDALCIHQAVAEQLQPASSCIAGMESLASSCNRWARAAGVSLRLLSLHVCGASFSQATLCHLATTRPANSGSHIHKHCPQCGLPGNAEDRTHARSLVRWQIGDHPDQPWLDPHAAEMYGSTTAVRANGSAAYNGSYPSDVIYKGVAYDPFSMHVWRLHGAAVQAYDEFFGYAYLVTLRPCIVSRNRCCPCA